MAWILHLSRTSWQTNTIRVEEKSISCSFTIGNIFLFLAELNNKFKVIILFLQPSKDTHSQCRTKTIGITFRVKFGPLNLQIQTKATAKLIYFQLYRECFLLCMFPHYAKPTSRQEIQYPLLTHLFRKIQELFNNFNTPNFSIPCL